MLLRLKNMLHERIVEHFVKKGILNQSYLYIKNKRSTLFIRVSLILQNKLHETLNGESAPLMIGGKGRGENSECGRDYSRGCMPLPVICRIHVILLLEACGEVRRC